MRNDEPTIVCERAERFEGLEEEVNRQQHEVWITLRLSGEDERAISNDKLRVQDLYTYLRARPGRDHYELLVENGEWIVSLTPSENTMGYTPHVHQELERILKGLGEIRVTVVDR